MARPWGGTRAPSPAPELPARAPRVQVIVDKWNLQIVDTKNPESDVQKMMAGQ